MIQCLTSVKIDALTFIIVSQEKKKKKTRIFLLKCKNYLIYMQSLQIGIIFKAFGTHCVLNRIKDSLEVSNSMETSKRRITCSIVRTYCSIIENFLDLKKKEKESFRRL